MFIEECFDEQISQYWVDLKAWADKNMIIARQITLDDTIATVYVRPNATASGVSGVVGL